MSWIIKHRARALAIICGWVTLLGLLGYWLAYPFFLAVPLAHTFGHAAGEAFIDFTEYLPGIKTIRKTELQTQDIRLLIGDTPKVHEDLIFLAIDDPTITSENLWPEEIEASQALQLIKKDGWPFNREVWAHVLDKLAAAGAKVVIFDLIYAGANPGDAAFAEALGRHRDIAIVGANRVNQQGMRAQGETIQLPSTTLLPQDFNDSRLGVVNFGFDEDNIVRKARYLFQHDVGQFAKFLPSIAAQAATKAGYGHLIPPGTAKHTFRYAGPPYTFKPHSLYEIFVSTYWEGREIEGEKVPGKYQGGDFFKDKIVMVGPEGHILKDELLSPYGSMPGPEIHLNALNALLQGEFVTFTPSGIDMLLIVLAGLLAWWVMYMFKTAWLSAVSFLVVGIGYLAFSQYLYDNWDLYILIVLPMATFYVSGFAGTVAEFFAERMERSRTRSTLERFVAKNIVKEVLENPDSFYNKLGGTRLPITVLFSDVRGFTTMTEESDPEQLIAQLNEYLRVMGDAVQTHNGILDKFIGDAIMATWGNISSKGFPEDARLAVAACLAMRERLEELNSAWRVLGWREWQFGIGLHQGEAIVGSIGSDKIKQDPTVIGDTINTGARMESSTKKYKVDLLVSDVMTPHLKDSYHLQSVDKVVFKGKLSAVEIYTVIDSKNTALSTEMEAYLKLYHKALTTFRPPTRDFTKAKALFHQAMEQRPDDHLAQMYIARCEQYEAAPPPDDWQGEEVALTK